MAAQVFCQNDTFRSFCTFTHLLFVVNFVSVPTRRLVTDAESQTVGEGGCAGNGLLTADTFPVSLLGLLAKIKCSICSYQFNI